MKSSTLSSVVISLAMLLSLAHSQDYNFTLELTPNTTNTDCSLAFSFNDWVTSIDGFKCIYVYAGIWHENWILPLNCRNAESDVIVCAPSGDDWVGEALAMVCGNIRNYFTVSVFRSPDLEGKFEFRIEIDAVDYFGYLTVCNEGRIWSEEAGSCIDEVIECMIGCDSCTTEDTCDVCSPGYFMNSTSGCSKCDTMCLTCEGEAEYCTSCPGDYLYEPLHTCQYDCLYGTYKDDVNMLCLDCDSNCATCNITATNCTSCETAWWLYEEACYEECPEGYVGDEETGTCIEQVDDECDSLINNITVSEGILITLNFSHEIYLNLNTTVSHRFLNLCPLIFTEESMELIGSDAYCTDLETEIKIYLYTKTTLSGEETLYFNENVIYNELCQEPISTTNFTLPDFNITFDAELVPTSTQINACTTLYLYVQVLSGSGGQRLDTIDFSLASTSPQISSSKISKIDKELNGRGFFFINRYKEYAYIRSYKNLLDPGVVYTFQVVLTNYLDMTITRTVDVEVTDDQKPSIKITGAINGGWWYPSKDLTLVAKANLNTCNSGIWGFFKTITYGYNNFYYSWEQTGDVTEENTINMTEMGNANHVLKIPRYTLKPGLGYQFTVTAVYKKDISITNTASFVITAHRSPLAPILWFKYLRFSHRMNLLLNASRSYDSDDSEKALSHEHLNFHWKCKEMTFKYLDMPCKYRTGENVGTFHTPVLNFEPGIFPPKYKFKWILTISTDDGRTASTESYTEIIEEDYKLEIKQLSSPVSTDKQKLQAVVTSSYGLLEIESCEWTCDKIGDLDSISTYPTPGIIIIEENSLEDGKTYTFSVSLTTTNNYDIEGSLEVTMRTAPYGGSFIVSPDEGDGYDTEFTFNCSNYISDYSLTYEYFFKMPDEQNWIKLTPQPVSDSEFATKLPYGDDDSTEVELKAKIISNGLYIEENTTVTVTKGEVEGTIDTIFQEINEQDPMDVMQGVSLGSKLGRRNSAQRKGLFSKMKLAKWLQPRTSLLSALTYQLEERTNVNTGILNIFSQTALEETSEDMDEESADEALEILESIAADEDEIMGRDPEVNDDGVIVTGGIDNTGFTTMGKMLEKVKLAKEATGNISSDFNQTVIKMARKIGRGFLKNTVENEEVDLEISGVKIHSVKANKNSIKSRTHSMGHSSFSFPSSSIFSSSDDETETYNFVATEFDKSSYDWTENSIDSTIISLELSKSSGEKVSSLENEVTLTFTDVEEEDGKSPKCYYWDESSFKFKNTGLTTKSYNKNSKTLTCSTSHFTPFGVLLDEIIEDANQQDKSIEEEETVIIPTIEKKETKSDQGHPIFFVLIFLGLISIAALIYAKYADIHTKEIISVECTSSERKVYITSDEKKKIEIDGDISKEFYQDRIPNNPLALRKKNQVPHFMDVFKKTNSLIKIFSFESSDIRRITRALMFVYKVFIALCFYGNAILMLEPNVSQGRILRFAFVGMMVIIPIVCVIDYILKKLLHYEA